MCIALTLDKAICMTKYNIGDKAESPISNSVNVVTAVIRIIFVAMILQLKPKVLLLWALAC